MDRDVLRIDGFEALSFEETQSIDGGAPIIVIPFAVKLGAAIIGTLLVGVGVGYLVNK